MYELSDSISHLLPSSNAPNITTVTAHSPCSYNDIEDDMHDPNTMRQADLDLRGMQEVDHE